jgi:hypothetical protein
MKLGPASGRHLRTEAECVHVIAGEGSVAFVGEGLLSTVPEGVDRAGDARKEAGIVEEGGTVVFSGFDTDSFGLEVFEIGSEAFV